MKGNEKDDFPSSPVRRVPPIYNQDNVDNAIKISNRSNSTNIKTSPNAYYMSSQQPIRGSQNLIKNHVSVSSMRKPQYILSNASMGEDFDSSAVPNEYANIAKFLTQGKSKRGGSSKRHEIVSSSATFTPYIYAP